MAGLLEPGLAKPLGLIGLLCCTPRRCRFPRLSAGVLPVWEACCHPECLVPMLLKWLRHVLKESPGLSQDYYGIPFAAPTALASRDGSLANNPYSGGLAQWVQGRGGYCPVADPRRVGAGGRVGRLLLLLIFELPGRPVTVCRSRSGLYLGCVRFCVFLLGDVTKFGRGDSASPAPPTTLAQPPQSQSQTHHTAQQPFLNPALPPGYSYTGLPYYTGVPSAFQYGPTMFVSTCGGCSPSPGLRS